MADRFDVCVVGAGLIGLATARAVTAKLPGVSVVVIEKEPAVARHQSSHNSGVVHSGLYYAPGSLKARLCVEGREAIFELSDDGFRTKRSGKIVVASHESELGALAELERRGRANGLTGMSRLTGSDIAAVEPYAIGVAALHVPEAGVADYEALAGRLGDELVKAGAEIRTGSPVTAIAHRVDGVDVTAGAARISARALINCAGLYSDRVAVMAGVDPSIRIVPFRGEYYTLSDEAAPLVTALIYPVPDPRFPFLGVHFSRRIDGSVEVGPNAVLALGREHYRGTRPDWSDVRDTLSHRGFRSLARTHWRAGAKEMIDSRSRRIYARSARRLVPGIATEYLLPGGSGVRAQAVDAHGKLVDDFVIDMAGSTVHVLNAPSPGATAGLAIGRYIAERAAPLIRG